MKHESHCFYSSSFSPTYFFHSRVCRKQNAKRVFACCNLDNKILLIAARVCLVGCFLGIPGSCDEIQPIWIKRNACLSYKKHRRLRLWLSAPPAHPVQTTISATSLYLQHHLEGTCKSFWGEKKSSFICLLFSLAFTSVALMCAFSPCWSFLNDSDSTAAYMQISVEAYHLQTGGPASGVSSGKFGL